MTKEKTSKLRKTILLFSLLLISVAVFFSRESEKHYLFTNKTIKNILNKETNAETVSNKTINLLVLGSDAIVPKHLKDWRGRSDVILFASINPISKTVSLISIPRDTKIKLKKTKVDRINAANAIGGYKFSKRAIKKLLRANIDHVMVLNLAGVTELIDIIGGVKLDVKKRMRYKDETAGLNINIQAGLQLLDGEQAVNYLRFRSDELGDIGRIQRHQKFFNALVKRLIQPDALFKMPELIQKSNRLFKTDMSFEKMFSLGVLLKSMPREAFKMHLLPGTFGEGKENGYWISDKAKVRDLTKSIGVRIEKK